METAKYVLAIYSWVVITILIAFLWRIAYFYQKASGERLGHHTLAIPALLLVAGAIWYILFDLEFVGQLIGDARDDVNYCH